MKNTTFVRIFACFLAVVILCGAIASCASTESSSEEISTTVTPEEDKQGDDKKPLQNQEEIKNLIRYGMTDPQSLKLSKIEYNENDQILSVTALNKATLSPMYGEKHKMDRVYRYDENGLLTSIWVSFGFLVELSYEETAEEGKIATGVAQNNDKELSVRVTLNEKNVLLKEEYFDGVSTIVVEYDERGNLLMEMCNEGWYLTREETEDGFSVSVKMGEITELRYVVTLNDDGTIATWSDGNNTRSYNYDDRACCINSEMKNMVCNMTYNANRQIILSDAYHDDTHQMESFEYDEDGKMIKYICHRKEAYLNEEQIFTYTYGEDGLVKRIDCEYVEYDQNDVEINRTTSIIE